MAMLSAADLPLNLLLNLPTRLPKIVRQSYPILVVKIRQR
jgi:hypothetical protein